MEVETAQQGEILCIVCPLRKTSQFLVVVETKSEFESRRGHIFYSLRPINVDFT